MGCPGWGGALGSRRDMAVTRGGSRGCTGGGCRGVGGWEGCGWSCPSGPGWEAHPLSPGLGGAAAEAASGLGAEGVGFGVCSVTVGSGKGAHQRTRPGWPPHAPALRAPGPEPLPGRRGTGFTEVGVGSRAWSGCLLSRSGGCWSPPEWGNRSPVAKPPPARWLCVCHRCGFERTRCRGWPRRGWAGRGWGACEPLLSTANCWKTTSPPRRLQGPPVQGVRRWGRSVALAVLTRNTWLVGVTESPLYAASPLRAS